MALLTAGLPEKYHPRNVTVIAVFRLPTPRGWRLRAADSNSVQWPLLLDGEETPIFRTRPEMDQWCQERGISLCSKFWSADGLDLEPVS